ncbi:MAG: NADH-ubiquinone oxidoreductase subunit NDUFA12 family protein [Parvularculaceae bacterium]
MTGKSGQIHADPALRLVGYDTYSTSLTLFRRGARLVGKDEQGNRYYEEKSPSGPEGGKRWVVYHGVADASRVPPDWHGWIHHIRRTADGRAVEAARVQKDHLPGHDRYAARLSPAGSLSRAGGPAPLRDYETWSPDN